MAVDATKHTAEQAAEYAAVDASFCATVESAQRETDYSTNVRSVHTTDAITNRTANVGSFRSAIDST